MANIQTFTARDSIVSAFQFNGPNDARLFDFCRQSYPEGTNWNISTLNGEVTISYFDANGAPVKFTVAPGSFVYFVEESGAFIIENYAAFLSAFVPVRIPKN